MSIIPTEEHDKPPTPEQYIEYDQLMAIELGRAPKPISEPTEATRFIDVTTEDIERYGAEAIIQHDRYNDAIEAGVRAEHFKVPAYRKLWQGVMDAVESGEDPDFFCIRINLYQAGKLSDSENSVLQDLNDIRPDESTGSHVPKRIQAILDTAIKRRFDELIHAADLHAKDGRHDVAHKLVTQASELGDTIGVAAKGLTYPFENYSEYWKGLIETALPEVGYFTADKALFYRGAVNNIYGAPGKGKSWIALCVCKEQVELGNDVIFIDPESSAKRIICRLKMLKTNNDLAEKHFHYSNQTDTRKIRELQRWAANRENVFVIYDGLANPIAASGKDENSNAALTILQDQVKSFADTGSAVLVVDHTGKDEKKGARGSSSKEGFYKGACYAVEVGKAFSKNSDGYLSLRMKKDNEGGTGLTVGQLAAELVVTVEGGTSKFELSEPSHANDDAAGAKVTMTDEGIRKAVPVGSDNAMRFTQISPALSLSRFTERCREIEGIHVEQRKSGSGQATNHFWRDA